MLIRKNDFRLNRFEARSKGQERVFTNANEDYLDPLDREVLCIKQKKQNKSFQPAPKWLNMSWDTFRHVENHNKSHMFQ